MTIDMREIDKIRERHLAKKRKQARDRKPRLRDFLKARYPTPELLLRQLGMDSAVNELGLQGSTSIMDNEGAREMAQHGTCGDGGDWREFAKSKGMSDDDCDMLADMMANRGAEDGEEDADEGYRDRVLRERGEGTTERHQNGRGQQASRQANLERSERRFAREDRDDDRRAASTERRNSEQNLDHELPRNATRGGMGGRLAGDSDLDFIHEAFDRLPSSGGRNLSRSDLALERERLRQRRMKPSAMAANSKTQSDRMDEMIEMFGEHFGSIAVQP